MASGGAVAIQQLLTDGIEQIATLPPDQPEAGVAAFNTFKRGVTQASSGREAPPDQLLADLDSKDVVWRFLLGLAERKPMYRKQVAAVSSVLLSCSPWAEALRADAALCADLPEELAAVLREAEGERAGEEEEEASEDVEEDKGPEVSRQRSRRRSSTRRALDLLAKGEKEIEALDYSAAKTDEAIDAFNSFQRAVMWVVSSPQKEDDEVLEGMQQKDQVLRFVVDFYARKPTHRLRIAALFVRLVGFDNWRAAVLADPSVRSVVWEMTKAPELAAPSPEESQRKAFGIDAAAREAQANGGVGAVYVRVIAAHDLVGASGPLEGISLHVNVALGEALRRTESIGGCLNPRWMSAPFLLAVPSWGTPLRLEVLDSGFDKDESFGSLELPVGDLPSEPGSGFSRHALEGVLRGELELELIFREAKVEGEDGEGRRRSSTWLVPGGENPAVVRNWSMTTSGGITCPAGHEVDECKEGRKTVLNLIGVKRDKQCGICHCVIPSTAARWRCSFHCDFWVCRACLDARGQRAS